ncbi:Glyoxalase-like domain protein [Streptomyces sp. YIM 130001]|uniref:VOC family protein n=1 Tax=Streptomyces sp. YIM 130001 TaxID=2259644 RepID=UPI000E651D47|nr:VOC family protein [Streptomyces sp. YIM 130001]RII13948.1 Glyoxalase-like domain protein [Streptomyces sp. YIM 130001]
MYDIGQRHLRIARPSRDLEAAERYWTGGLGLQVLYRTTGSGGPGEHDLLMVGAPDADWHLELTHQEHALVEPRPTEEDLLVLYFDGAVPEALLARLEEHGGTRVTSPNPYWNEWGVTVQDPDGYRLVLCTRAWTNT